MFYFATPEETPAAMNELIDWFRNEEAEHKKHPLLVACLFHYKFVRIHPFDDGNGRMSRILMNFILMMYGFPPVIIPTKEKSNYILALEYADKANIENFVQYVGQQLIVSLQLVLKAAKGENLEDETDLDKMLAMLDKRIENIDENKGITKERTQETQLDLYENCLEPLNSFLFTKLEKFNRYFKYTSIEISNQHRAKSPQNLVQLNEELKHLLAYTNYPEIEIRYKYSTLTKLGLVHYDLSVWVAIKFEQLYYKIGFGCIENNTRRLFHKFEKHYHQGLYYEELQTISKKIAEYIITEIESEIGKIENGT